MTELEHTILGVIFLHQPCTAYTVRSVFSRSLSARWTSSAGSIYPAMRRLAQGGHLKVRSRENDGRNPSLYALSEKGRADLETWLTPPLPPAGELLTVDPLRTRLSFLAAIPSDQALATLREGREKLRVKLEEVRREKRRAGADGAALEALTHRAAELTLKAQLQWLGEAIRHLEHSA